MIGAWVPKWPALLVLCVVLGWYVPAGADSIGFGIGGYHSTNCESCRDNPDVNIDRSRLWSLEYYFGSILGCRRNWRFGVRVSFLRARVTSINPHEPRPPGSGSSKHWMTSLLASHQRKLYNRGWLYFGAYFSAGITFLGYEGGDAREACTPPFCTWKETEVSVQSGLDYMVNIYRGLGVRVSGGYNFLTGGKTHTYPFGSGFVFEGGLLLEIPPCGSK